MTEAQIVEALLDFIATDGASDDEFNALALQIFAYQFENNAPYQRFCRQRERTPRTAQNWRDIPAVPINGYKDLTLSCCDPKNAERTFMTSGTTKDGVRGKCHHPTLSVYDTSMVTAFRQRFMQEHNKLRMGILFPTEETMPNSSLAHYLALALSEFGTEGSCYLLSENGLDSDLLFAELDRAEKTGEPYALLGASFSFVHVMDEMERLGKIVSLPEGSRILDTGGFKGQSRELELNAFYDLLESRLGVPRKQCINMYGMTELSTEFYDWGNPTCPSVKSGPHWIRSQIVNPLTGEELPKGDKGVLAHCDLAHFNCVSSILTEDAGIEVDNGFLLLGRAEGAEAKGCSMAVDEFLKAAQG
ncbi:MAG: long-chain fatty acid--CoA ligase [Alphaproteobacteria bacterium]|nr:long-chain fatty acid--CoA ligase [Alphaproteobacteria bacterium]